MFPRTRDCVPLVKQGGTHHVGETAALRSGLPRIGAQSCRNMRRDHADAAHWRGRSTFQSWRRGCV
ncbi:Hypothetical protein A7982_08099 [Minicystis rosea]|nr:Hypothetical protein A7982_08099 [Minicystis rosea]